MKNNVFGSLIYNMGWEMPYSFKLWGKEYNITIHACANNETDMVTKEQEKAFVHFVENAAILKSAVEKALIDFSDDEKRAKEMFAPTMLNIERDGNYAVLFDDCLDVEGGVAVTIKPQLSVVPIDAYL